MDWSEPAMRKQVLDDLQDLARRSGAIFIKIDPDVVLGTGVPGEDKAQENPGGKSLQQELITRGWVFSRDQIQFRNTVLIDLQSPESELLARMKQKTRYNIRLAEKKGVMVRTGTLSDLPLLYRMYAETSVRDGFTIRGEEYYRTVWQSFMQTSPDQGYPHAVPLIAEVDSIPVAAIFIFTFADRAYYIYGMSRQEHRDKMPNHLLQWEAMRYAKASGCQVYDLWGAPETFNETDSLWGVFRFKEGLGGKVVRTLGAWDYSPNPLLYKLYMKTLPSILSFMRKRGDARAKRSTE